MYIRRWTACQDVANFENRFFHKASRYTGELALCVVGGLVHFKEQLYTMNIYSRYNILYIASIPNT